MKENKCCPKCQGKEIYTDAGLPKGGDRCFLPVSNWSKIFIDTYICANCGYIEEYAKPSDLNNEKVLRKLRENWKIHR